MEETKQPVLNPQINQQGGGVLRSFDTKNKKQKTSIIYGAIGILVILAGVGTGWLLSGGLKAKSSSVASGANDVSESSGGDVSEAGEIVSDQVQEAEGELKEGGFEGEGTHTLDRGLGEEKNVTLFSTSLNLDNFVGKKVHVWGETVSSAKASWLMDVNKIKVIN
jgi:hypothetical protein